MSFFFFPGLEEGPFCECSWEACAIHSRARSIQGRIYAQTCGQNSRNFVQLIDNIKSRFGLRSLGLVYLWKFRVAILLYVAIFDKTFTFEKKTTTQIIYAVKCSGSGPHLGTKIHN